MANLIQDNAQVNALNAINSMLEEVKILNERILSSKPYTIEVEHKKSPKQKQTKAAIVLDRTLAPKLVTILRVQRERRVKDIRAKAEKYRIALSESEVALLSDEALTQEESKAKPPCTQDSETDSPSNEALAAK